MLVHSVLYRGVLMKSLEQCLPLVSAVCVCFVSKRTCVPSLSQARLQVRSCCPHGPYILGVGGPIINRNLCMCQLAVSSV